MLDLLAQCVDVAIPGRVRTVIQQVVRVVVREPCFYVHIEFNFVIYLFIMIVYLLIRNY